VGEFAKYAESKSSYIEYNLLVCNPLTPENKINPVTY
jgi:hypothetical protein